MRLRDVAIIELAYACGARVAELARLDVAHVDFEQRTILLMGKGKHRVSGRATPRTSLFHPRAREALQRWLIEGRALEEHLGVKVGSGESHRTLPALARQQAVASTIQQLGAMVGGDNAWQKAREVSVLIRSADSRVRTLHGDRPLEELPSSARQVLRVLEAAGVDTKGPLFVISATAGSVVP